MNVSIKNFTSVPLTTNCFCWIVMHQKMTTIFHCHIIIQYQLIHQSQNHFLKDSNLWHHGTRGKVKTCWLAANCWKLWRFVLALFMVNTLCMLLLSFTQYLDAHILLLFYLLLNSYVSSMSGHGQFCLIERKTKTSPRIALRVFQMCFREWKKIFLYNLILRPLWCLVSNDKTHDQFSKPAMHYFFEKSNDWHPFPDQCSVICQYSPSVGSPVALWPLAPWCCSQGQRAFDNALWTSHTDVLTVI